MSDRRSRPLAAPRSPWRTARKSPIRLATPPSPPACAGVPNPTTLAADLHYALVQASLQALILARTPPHKPPNGPPQPSDPPHLLTPAQPAPIHHSRSQFQDHEARPDALPLG